MSDSQQVIQNLLQNVGIQDVLVDGIWTRARTQAMQSLPPAGWKIHVSAIPSELLDTVSKVAEVLQDKETPFKITRDEDTLEQLNDGRFGLTQSGKAITIYPTSERAAHELCVELAQRLTHHRGPAILAERCFSPEAPVYFRYGAFDGRIEYDDLGRKQRLITLPDGTNTVDAPEHYGRFPRPTLLPQVDTRDHLDFLRADFLFLQVIQFTPKGTVLIALPRTGENRKPVIIKTARKDALSDPHGRDAVWALQREVDLAGRLHDIPGLIIPGRILRNDHGSTIAVVRPYVDEQTFIERWQLPGARLPDNRHALATALLELSSTLESIHDRGIILRDLSPANLLTVDGRFLILDLELAHDLRDTSPPYRRGTKGFYDPDRPRDAHPSWRDDAYSMSALAQMTLTGLHPQWWTMPGIPVHQEATKFWHEYRALCSSSKCLHRPAEAWSWDANAARIALYHHVVHRIQGLAGAQRNPDAVNVFSGVSGELMVLADWHLQVDGFPAALPFIQAAAKLVSHIPGYHFGPLGIGLALTRAFPGLNPAVPLDLLLNLPWQSSKVPDFCHGLAGYLYALLEAHALLDNPRLLERARQVAIELSDRAEWIPGDIATCCWPWPEGPYRGLSGSRQYGHAHGAAGIVLPLARAAQELSLDGLQPTIEGGLAFLLGATQAVPGHDSAIWWAVSAEDESCWNSWSHGTPGIVKTLCYPALAVPANEINAALEGIRSSNNAGYCLCHGVASRLDAYIDAAQTLGNVAPAWLAEEALQDATHLAKLDLFAIEAREIPEAGDDGYGYMKGAAGVLHTLLRFDRALRSGIFHFPNPGAPLVSGQVLTR